MVFALLFDAVRFCEDDDESICEEIQGGVHENDDASPEFKSWISIHRDCSGSLFPFNFLMEAVTQTTLSWCENTDFNVCSNKQFSESEYAKHFVLLIE